MLTRFSGCLERHHDLWQRKYFSTFLLYCQLINSIWLSLAGWFRFFMTHYSGSREQGILHWEALVCWHWSWAPIWGPDGDVECEATAGAQMMTADRMPFISTNTIKRNGEMEVHSKEREVYFDHNYWFYNMVISIIASAICVWLRGVTQTGNAIYGLLSSDFLQRHHTIDPSHRGRRMGYSSSTKDNLIAITFLILCI